ncbi:MAG: 2,3-bisphosphoglycerate-independent phosphoglycerate mutase [Alistipes sp.]|nr:2,3-bisphosphoglycerate-independent phosphoglycerate mutase [Alistipes sp.]
MENKIDKKVLLMILDGWGKGDGGKDDVIAQARPEYMNALTAKYPHAQLLTDGENVGLPDGQMGNSEVGHLNIGAGRVVYQDLVKINRACRDGSIAQNPEVVKAFEYARSTGAGVHFMGLVSDGGVHSSMEHLFALCDIAREAGVSERTFVHCFMDGRDTDPRSGLGFIEALQKNLNGAKIATIIGRYYAMDRDKRWERVKIAYDALVSGVGATASVVSGVGATATAVSGAGSASATPSAMAEAVQASYDEGVTDEFIKPIVGVGADGKPVGLIKPSDVVIFFNFRNDRAKELTAVLTQTDMPEAGMHTMPLYYCTMTPYDASFEGLHILFDKDNVANPLGEYLSGLGLSQLRIAETEKYAHVTFFLNGGREAVFEGEERILVPSPKVATYDLQPEMSAPEVAEKLVAAIDTQKFDFIALNFANGDMVGHTGVYDAIVQAVKTVDRCAGQVIDAARKNGYEVVVIADHGNADHALNDDGSPNTAHSLNPVPIIVVSDRVTKVENGVLADVAPTVLRLMGLPRPAEMTGRALVEIR